jgi:hypothetical protein
MTQETKSPAEQMDVREALILARPFVEAQADVESGMDHDDEPCAANLLKQIDAALRSPAVSAGGEPVALPRFLGSCSAEPGDRGVKALFAEPLNEHHHAEIAKRLSAALPPSNPPGAEAACEE